MGYVPNEKEQSNMMKIWLKIERILNTILTAILGATAKFIQKVTPSKVKKSIEATKKKSIDYKSSSKSFVTKKLNSVKSFTGQSVQKSLSVVNTTKEKTLKTVSDAKSYNWKSLTPAKVSAIIATLCAPFLNKLKAWYLTLQPKTILTFTVVTMAFSITSVSIYQESKEISDKAKEKVREPASVGDTMKRSAWTRSKYRHHQNKMLHLSSVSVPVYIENRKGMQSLKIDFTFVTNNRYTTKYFTKIENEYLIRDRLNKSLLPVIPEFPMEQEGKKIIKTKIKAEINKLINDLKIEGKVENIYIKSILNG